GPAVYHDRGVEARLGGEVAAERHAAALPRRGVGRRDVLDGELGPVQLGTPARLEALYGGQDVILEHLRARAVGGEVVRHDRPAQATAATVPPSDGERLARPRVGAAELPGCAHPSSLGARERCAREVVLARGTG